MKTAYDRRRSAADLARLRGGHDNIATRPVRRPDHGSIMMARERGVCPIRRRRSGSYDPPVLPRPRTPRPQDRTPRSPVVGPTGIRDRPRRPIVFRCRRMDRFGRPANRRLQEWLFHRGRERDSVDGDANLHGASLDDAGTVNANFPLAARMSGWVDAAIGTYRDFEMDRVETEKIEDRRPCGEKADAPTYGGSTEVAHSTNSNRIDSHMAREGMQTPESATRAIVSDPKESRRTPERRSPDRDDGQGARIRADGPPRFTLRSEAPHERLHARFGRFPAKSRPVRACGPFRRRWPDMGAK